MLSGCSAELPMEKALQGTWVQDTPTSMTSQGVQTTTADTVLNLYKNKKVQLSRNLDIAGQQLPQSGVSVSVELRGTWELVDTRLTMTLDNVLIIPRKNDATTRQWADQLQIQAQSSPPSIKTVISVENKQLILQDVESGATDVYTRK